MVPFSGGWGDLGCGGWGRSEGEPEDQTQIAGANQHAPRCSDGTCGVDRESGPRSTENRCDPTPFAVVHTLNQV